MSQLTGKVLHWVPDVDMRNAHDGLAAIAKKELRVNVEGLQPGEFVLFMNQRWTAFKLYASNHTILHHRDPNGRRLNAKAVLQLPNFVRGQHVNYDKALASVIRAEYGERYGQPSQKPES